jgi:BolA family transcriptional regulator, general stress-responsive regulator
MSTARKPSNAGGVTPQQFQVWTDAVPWHPAVMTLHERIEQKLSVLTPDRIELIDDSDRHAGHEGSRGGGGHFNLIIVSSQFSGKPSQARHRMVHAALGDMFQREIHALSIKAYTPDEI